MWRCVTLRALRTNRDRSPISDAWVGWLACVGWPAWVGRWCLGRQEPLGATVSAVSLPATWFSCYIQENHVAFKTQLFSTNYWVQLPFSGASAQPHLDIPQFHSKRTFSPLKVTKKLQKIHRKLDLSLMEHIWYPCTYPFQLFWHSQLQFHYNKTFWLLKITRKLQKNHRKLDLSLKYK